jgi:hypothetical protein
MKTSKIIKSKGFTVKLELETIKDGGGQINVWTLADTDDKRRATKLPHIFHLSKDEKWSHSTELNYAYAENAKDRYRTFKTVTQVFDFALANA